MEVLSKLSPFWAFLGAFLENFFILINASTSVLICLLKYASGKLFRESYYYLDGLSFWFYVISCPLLVIHSNCWYKLLQYTICSAGESSYRHFLTHRFVRYSTRVSSLMALFMFAAALFPLFIELFFLQLSLDNVRSVVFVCCIWGCNLYILSYLILSSRSSNISQFVLRLQRTVNMIEAWLEESFPLDAILNCLPYTVFVVYKTIIQKAREWKTIIKEKAKSY